MPLIPGRVAPVLLASAVLVGGANLAAYAANGSPLLIGQKNAATKTTTVKNAKGTALSLTSKKGKAPLKVSNSTTVSKLSADLVDGLDGAALQNKTYVYDLTGTTGSDRLSFTLPGLPAGRYLATYDISAAAGGSTRFLCVFNAGSVGAVPATGGDLGGTFLITGTGYLDTRTLTYVLTCVTDDPGITIPAVTTPPTKSQVVLTRVDDVTTTATTGN